MILALQTTTFSSHGGIPTCNRCVCRVLDEIETGAQACVLIATDTPGDVEKSSGYQHLRIEGFSANRVAFAWRALRVVWRQTTKLVLVGHVHYAPLGLLFKTLRPKLRYGVMVHGVEVWSRLPLAQRYALQRADFIASVSEYTKRQLVEINGIRADRIYIVPDTLEWDAEGTGENAEPRADCSDDSGAAAHALNEGLTMLSVCRLEASERYKGIDTVIRALPQVVSQIPDLRYVIIGTGSDVERHKQLAQQQGVAQHVHFLGAVDASTLHAHYESCDLFIMPSAGEGFGIVYLEAMHYRKPVVAARCTAVPEVVADGISGLLVEYDNPAQLSQAILRLAADRPLREAMGQAGYQRLKQNFTFPQFQRRLSDLLLRELPKSHLSAERLDEPSVEPVGKTLG